MAALDLEYAPNTWGPKAESMMDPVGGWIDPKGAPALR